MWPCCLKYRLKCYYRPTPKKWRKVGDGLLAFSVFVAPCAVLAKHDSLAISVFVIGGIGKFLTNFFAVDKKERHEHTTSTRKS